VLENLLCSCRTVVLALAFTIVSPISSYSFSPPLITINKSSVPNQVLDDCGIKRVGVMGASNTVGKSYVRYLRELCPSTEFIVRAHGGYSPREQLKYLLPGLLEEKIELLIVSPSGNDLERHDHVAAMREIVGRAKQKGVETAVLSVSPRSRYYQEWKEFNNYLLHEKLGVSSLIDDVVDITSPLLRNGSEYICGYCKKDGLHWTDLGDQRVAAQIYNTLWGKKKLKMPEK